MLLLHESVGASGERQTVEVGADDGALLVHVDGEPTALPMSVLDAVMTRYGKPLETGVPLEGPSVDLGGGASLQRIRSLGFYDVIAKDYVVWSGPGHEPLAELATSISAALVHFVRAARGSR